MHPTRVARSGLSLLVLAGVLWGTGGLVGSLFGAAAGLPPVAVACYRLLAGGALLCGWVAATGRTVPVGRSALVRIGLAGLLAAEFQACYFGAVAAGSVGVATFVTIGTAPVVVVAAELCRGRRPGARTLAGAAPALVGLALLVGVPAGGHHPWLAAALAVAAGCGFAALTLLGGRPVPGLDAASTIGPAFLLGGLLLVPFALAGGGLGVAANPAAWLLLAALGLGPTALAYAAYFAGLRTAPAGVGALLALLEPLTAAGLAAVVLGQRLGPAALAGAGLLVVALVVVGSSGAPVGGQVPARRA